MKLTGELKDKVEQTSNLEEAKDVCDFYRRQYILNKVREKKMGNIKRVY